MQPKRRRQELILSLIQRHKLSTQQELVDALAKSRIEATQSSVSRDLEELGVIKIQGFYAPPSAARALGARQLVSVERSGDSMLVLKCGPGLASAISIEIDRAALPSIIGTIAGDDTIFIATRNAKAQKVAHDAIRALFIPGTTGESFV